MRSEPIASFRQLLLPRLRKFLLFPHPQPRQEAYHIAAILTGIFAHEGREIDELERMVLVHRDPAAWVLARWLDAEGVVTRKALVGLAAVLRPALAAVQAAGYPERVQTCPPIAVDIELPAASLGDVAVCDACGLHAYFSCVRKQPAHKLRTCLGCKARHYCSQACQAAHWPGHRRICQAAQKARAAQAAAAAPAGSGS